MYEDKEKASNAIFLLSKIMRYMLKESNEEKTALEKEMDYVRDYIELAKLSFKDSTFLSYSCSGEFNGKQVPPLLFIPVIENTIKHCNKQVKAPGIEINCKIEKDYIEVKTTNSVKQNDFKLPDSGSGNGLKNLEKRLKLLFDKNYVFEIKHNMDKFDVQLKVPLL
jgi:LytS/YehU family sensor histidine kinase